ncbi:LIC11966 family surface protein [Filimonas effusa]|uniref:DUF3829 domain-containing protein n=1 Tax=Filimonas effusa TaxID=2508721 RepID=A0A4Q1D602_9BACT|nr:hypothetical protein [Filimonas effusa]RXK83838.1 hypothetical protein ESB13_17360 [Filimonas effusa]
MKKMIMKHYFFLLMLLSLVAAMPATAQTEDPVKYLSAIYAPQQEMNKTYMAYVSAMAHSKRAKKIEKMRMQTLEGIEKCRYKTIDIPFYKGDNALRKSSLDYIQLCYKLFNDDYAHIVNMDEIAEQSFDEMQAYLLLQEKTEEKLQQASKNMSDAVDSFAAKYHVQLVEGQKDELSIKMAKAGEVNKYHNKVYLLFFKCNWQDGQLTNAFNKKKLTEIEQSRNALSAFANEGLAVLDTLKNLEGDPALAGACKNALQFYKKSAEEATQLADFLLKEEAFEKLQKSFEAKSAKDRTKEDVDAYNKAVGELNAAADKFNKTNTALNNGRNQVIQQWNETERSFVDAHMPHY